MSPNILLIHTDQQATWTIGAHGGTEVATPHIDRLAQGGVVFQNCHTVCAVCTPSRGSLMTGLYPHQHGAATNNAALDPAVTTWAQMLRRGGYRTGYVGKWHLDGAARPGFVHPARGRGFADTRAMFNRGHWKRMWARPRIGEPGVGPEIGDEREYTTDWLTSRALEFMGEGAGEPFALMLSIPDPHTPFSVREPYASRFEPGKMRMPESWRDGGVPSWARRHEAQWSGSAEEDERQLREWRATYLGMVACIDDNVGRLLDHLAERGLAERTLVIFTSDHGEYLGEHGLMGKNLMYRAAYHVPCVMRLPGTLPAGARVERMVTQNDFAPTLCALAGVDAPPGQLGRDLRPLWEDEDLHWRDEVQQHHPSHALAGLLTRRWHLVLDRGGEHRLFDLEADAEEMTNLYDGAACAEVRDALTRRIRAHHEDTGSPAAPWLCRVG